MVANPNDTSLVIDPANPDTWPMFLSAEQVAFVLNVERHVVYAMIGNKRMKAKKAGKEWRIKKTDLLNF